VQPSAWIDYPKKYRFIGIQIFMSADKEVIKRKMYSIVEAISGVANSFVIL